MAPLPENNTSRLFIDYTSQSTLHTMQFRYEGVQTTPNLEAAYDVLGETLASYMVNYDSVTGARYQNAGTNFTINLSVPSIAGTRTAAANIWQEDPDSAQLSIVARDNTTGRKCKWLFFTPYNFGFSWPTDNRYQPGENTIVDAMVTEFTNNAAGAGAMPFPLVSIANGPLVVYQYVNICKNGYWEKEQRG